MLKNYLKIALRNLLKNKTYSFINILGLTTGIACFLIIALYIFDELTYDTFHKNAPSLYRVVETRTEKGKESKVASVSFQLSEQAPSSIPGVTKAARLTSFGRTTVSNPDKKENAFYEDNWYTTQAFLDVFDFPLIDGNRAAALKDPYTVLITEDMAMKLYGTTQVVGKSLDAEDTSLYKITGVLKNFPSNSHISCNVIYSEASLSGDNYTNFINNDWASNFYSTYLLLDKNTNPANVAQSLTKQVAAKRTANNEVKSTFALQPLKDIHFNSEGLEASLGRAGNKSYIYIFSIVALFVLLIACINYMNLTTARFTNRAKEIAVRKVAGAMRKNLISQFLSEAMLLTLLALVLAVVLVKIFLPFFNSFTEKQLSLGLESDYRIWIGIGVIVLLVGLLSGAYPALIQSKHKPFQLLKNKLSPGKGSLSVRQGLVVFQFALSIIMIAATMVVYLQLQYLGNKDMGFDKEKMVVVDINSGKVRRGAETIKTEFAKLPAVKSVTTTTRVPGEWKAIPTVKVINQGNNDAQGSDMYFLGADEQFLQTFKITLIDGSNFTKGSASDSSAVLINETAAKQLGITKAAGQLIRIPSANFNGSLEPVDEIHQLRQVKGIVKDFNFQSLREPLAPMIIASTNNFIHRIDYFTAKLSGGNDQETLAQMEKIIHSIDAGHLFEYHFLDKQWELFYREDQKRQTIFIAIALITIVIACLGLFGLATYAAEQRIKEIGIRKVLGASISGIVLMLSKDFLKLVLIAAIIAIPVAWWAMHTWLKDFAYRINVSWWVLASAGILALLIALLTVSFRAIKAAVANPVRSLRSE